MTGKHLREKLYTLDSKLTDVAKKLDISKQSLDQILKSQDIKTGLIESLSAAYNVPVSYFFDAEGGVRISQAEGGGSAVSGDGNSIDTIPPRIMAMIEEKDRQIHRLIDLLEKK